MSYLALDSFVAEMIVCRARYVTSTQISTDNQPILDPDANQDM